MKVLNQLKAPFGKGKFSRVKNASYRQWEDAFEVEFDDGRSFLEPHKTIRRANRISPKAVVEKVELEEELRHRCCFTRRSRQTSLRGPFTKTKPSAMAA